MEKKAESTNRLKTYINTSDKGGTTVNKRMFFSVTRARKIVCHLERIEIDPNTLHTQKLTLNELQTYIYKR